MRLRPRSGLRRMVLVLGSGTLGFGALTGMTLADFTQSGMRTYYHQSFFAERHRHVADSEGPPLDFDCLDRAPDPDHARISDEGRYQAASYR